MNILAFDTADEVLSLALECKSGFYFLEIDKPGSHLELLMECTDTLCKKAGILAEEINKIVCMKGPGSFTGLRIGYSA
ncbi:MAG: tRNA (adenosine(37)-N6)-threonylcarbamoyltransferase complex dimerization subunit type 1 TsaB, partial [Treponema sp.]|nr:tRNA (adenosine(37)-N6)-threonylcarbamoyltransferase complex dimerization subunit type 1 TsaB [Treponema sp.]